MRNIFFAILFILVGLGGIAAYLSAFVVEQTEQALVLEFGKPQRVITTPGLYFKYPIVQTVQFFDKRILALDTTPQEVIASDQKRLVVDAFSRFQIVDPLLFFQAVQDERIARSRLGSSVDASLRRVLGTATFEDVVRDRRDALMRQIASEVNIQAEQFGIKIIDVRIKRADLPQANSQAIFRRMQTEREQEASEIRAQGQEAGQRIRANADRQVTIIKAEAERESQQIRGEGDALRNKIYAEAYGRDEDFFSFYRSMQAYETGFKANDTRLVLSPDSPFFDFFGNPFGRETGAQIQARESGTPASRAAQTPVETAPRAEVTR
jgi:membrane protease subunit HflC